jgi:CRISPR-associated exonuclease Cas4
MWVRSPSRPGARENRWILALYSEDDLLPLSALQHLAFCERQWGLIHLEQQWSENRLTAEGRLLHENADTETTEIRDGVRTCRGLRIRSLRHGIAGRADVVEFGSDGPRPVEYKRGKPKSDDMDQVQLCAQALCLEEMLGVSIPEGSLFYGEPRRKTPVIFDQKLRLRVESLIARLHELTRVGVTPAPVYAAKCKSCSLLHVCGPKTNGGKSAKQYMKTALRESLRPVGGQGGS